MNNVLSVASHSGSLCLKQTPIAQQAARLRTTFISIKCRPAVHLASPRYLECNRYRPGNQHFGGFSEWRSFSRLVRQDFHNTFAAHKLKPYNPKATEQGIAFQEGDLDSHQLQVIFGPTPPPPRFANQLLRVLHGRRIDGTLDVALPAEFDSYLRKHRDAINDGLRWLRSNHPFDEDEAIIQRIEREDAAQERENPADLMRRGEELGLYKPQSGKYQALLSEKEGDVFGVSQLDRIRAENIQKFEQEEEELRQDIEQTQAEIKEKYGKLATVPENAIELADATRQPNLYETWILRSKKRASSKLEIDAPEVEGPTVLRRLLPSFLFATILSGLCYTYAIYWVPPKRIDRMFPDIGLSFATVGAIIGINVLVFSLWRFPPAWRILNRYFITIPGQPVPLSMICGVFSHQSFKHLAYNMAWILLLGISLHEDIGRGNFLALYISSGSIASFVSLTNYTLKGLLMTSSLGASGAVSAVVAAYCMIHTDERFTFFFIPREWHDTISFTGAQFFAGMILFQVAGYFRRLKTTDYASHLGGYAVGAAVGWRLRKEKGERKGNRRLTWMDHMLGKRNQDDLGWYGSAKK